MRIDIARAAELLRENDDILVLCHAHPDGDTLGCGYALMGIGAARIYLSPQSTERSMALNVYITQLIFNFFWSLIFFNAQAYLFAFFWLLILLFLVLWMILSFLKVDPLSAKLQIPYLLWPSFAAYLNLGVWYLNR